MSEISVSENVAQEMAKSSRPLPVVIASRNGLAAVKKAYDMILAGSKPLDAVIAGVNIVENDPNDDSVGYGGLPNEDGEVELDASVMDGLTHRCGAVGALKHIKNPSQVARLVMERSNRVFLVGEGALRFALAHGFQKENLLTDASREKWLKWKENLSDKDDWVPPRDEKGNPLDHGTINCNAVAPDGNIAGCTTTSGLPFKIAGRVGDSPIIGAGLYVDNEVGACGSTGNGEANIKVCGAHTVVEFMRTGKSPEEACLLTLQRIVDIYRRNKLEVPEVNYYAVNKRGQYAGARIYQGGSYAVADALGARLRESAYLLERRAQRAAEEE